MSAVVNSTHFDLRAILADVIDLLAELGSLLIVSVGRPSRSRSRLIVSPPATVQTVTLQTVLVFMQRTRASSSPFNHAPIQEPAEAGRAIWPQQHAFFSARYIVKSH